MRSDMYWIEGATPPGRLAVSPRPRGGDWLEDEVRGWREAGVDRVVSLLTLEEEQELELTAEATLCAQEGLSFHSVPVPDRGLPSARSNFREVARDLHAALLSGGSILIHCRQGIGRASLMAASVMAEAGTVADEALLAIERARGRPVPDTEEQRAWLGAAIPPSAVHRSTQGGAEGLPTRGRK